MSSSMSFSVKECSTTGHVGLHMFLTLKTSSPQQKTSQHEPLTVLCKLINLFSLDGDTSTVQQGPFKCYVTQMGVGGGQIFRKVALRRCNIQRY